MFRSLKILLFVVAGLLFQSPVQADVRLPDGSYYEVTNDLRVKVMGGYVTVARTWFNGRWYFNSNWDDLSFTYDNLDGSVQSITRAGSEYKLTSPGVYVLDPRNTIRSTATGYRWQDRKGNWIEFDTNGKLQSYGDRNNVKVTFQYDSSGKRTGVFDHFGTQVLWYEYTNNVLTAIRDYTARRVQYQYTGNNLTKVTDVLGNPWVYTYDGANKLLTKTDPENRKTTITYTANGRVATVRDNDNIGPNYAYDYDSAKKQFYIKETGPSGRVTETWYDADGGVVRQDVNGRNVVTTTVDGRTRSIKDQRDNQTTYDYDEWGNLIKVTHPDGAVATYTYDTVYSNLTQKIDEDGYTFKYEYDSKGNLTRSILAVGTPEQKTTENTVDQYGNTLSSTRKGGTASNGTLIPDATLTSTYDSYGNRITAMDGEGNVTGYEYNVLGRATKVTDPKGNEWVLTYDVAGNLTKIAAPNATSVLYGYDKVGNLTKVTDARSKVYTYSYDAQNREIKGTDPYGKSYLREFNGLGLVTKETDEDGRTTETNEYDLDGRPTASIDGRGNAIRLNYVSDTGSPASKDFPGEIVFPTYKQLLKYDARNRLTLDTSVVGQEGLVNSYKYDKRGNQTESTDPNGKTRFYAYDGFGRATKFTDALNQAIELTWDTRDNLIQLKDGNGKVTKFEYDRANRLTKEIRPLGQTSSYAYDSNSNLSNTILPNGNKVVYTYDSVDRVTKTEVIPQGTSVPSLTYSFTYDATDNLTGWSDGQMSGAITYDDNGYKTTESVTYGVGVTLSYSYTYTDAGYKKSLTYPDNSVVNFTHDANGDLSALDIPGEGTISVNEWNWAVPRKITLPGGTTQDLSYDGLLNLTGLKVKTPAQSVVADLVNKYGKMRDLTERTVDGSNSTFEYDAEQHLTKVTGSNGGAGTESFTYDASGNRITHSATAGDWVYDANNRLTQKGNTTYKYDDNGNLTEKNVGGQISRYKYDGFDRLVQVEDGSGVVIVKYSYDPFDLRLSKEVAGLRTLYLYSDEGLIAEANASGVVATQYGWRPDGEWQTDPVFIKTTLGGQPGYVYLHNDQLGTPIRATDKTGNLVWKSDFNSFGRATVDSGVSTVVNNLRFAGQYFDQETGFHYNTRRYYDPDTGRYITQDPLGIAGGWNLYGYADANPINATDPTGEWVWIAIRIAITVYDYYTEYKAIKEQGECYDWTRLIPIPIKVPKVLLKNKWLKKCSNPCECMGGGGRNSFSPDTLVHVRPAAAEDGDAKLAKSELKPIKEIKVGDEVLSFAEWKDKGELAGLDERLAYEKVTDIVRGNKEYQLVEIIFDDGEKLTATAGHPFYVVGKGWRDAELLRNGDVIKPAVDTQRVRTISYIRYKSGYTEVFNLEVANAHTFFVGDEAVLAHNAIKRRPVNQVRQEWENIHDKPWPKLPNGRNYVCHHIDPLADGGADHGSNVTPMTPSDHTRHHQQNGDFKRWGGRGRR